MRDWGLFHGGVDIHDTYIDIQPGTNFHRQQNERNWTQR